MPATISIASAARSTPVVVDLGARHRGREPLPERCQVDAHARLRLDIDQARQRQVLGIDVGAEPRLQQRGGPPGVEGIGAHHPGRGPQHLERERDRTVVAAADGGRRQLHRERAGEPAVPARDGVAQHQRAREREARQINHERHDPRQEAHGAVALQR
jgi:hypothetical protein